MIIHSDFRGNYNQDPCKNFGFEKFQNGVDNFIFCIGIGTNFKKGHLDFIKKNKGKKIILLQLEEPNKFFKEDYSFKHEKYVLKILTLCPYISKWANKRNNSNKRIPVFIPFNKEFLPKNYNKKYDVIYMGSLFPNRILKIAKIISKFNYRIISHSSFGIIQRYSDKLNIILSKSINNIGYFLKIPQESLDIITNFISKIINRIIKLVCLNKNDLLITNKGCSYKDKLNLISQSKITIVYNLIDSNKGHITRLSKLPGIKSNKSFKKVFYNNPDMFVPQIKSRLFEAAFCKSLILCRKDQWNLIENFFEKDKEFVYYNDERELNAKIKEILFNYDKYKLIIDNAYKRAIRDYTTEAFYNRYLKQFDK
jgi:hypothetical protein